MNKKAALTSEMTVKEVLDSYPQAIQVFMDIGLLCVDCPAEAFHTLEDVAREYKLDLNQLLESICRTIEEGTARFGLSPKKGNNHNGIRKN